MSHCYSYKYVIFTLVLFIALAICSCGRNKNARYTEEQRKTISNLIRKNDSIPLLEDLLNGYTKEKNLLGIVLVEKELGKDYRETSRFMDAINSHRNSLWAAKQLKDTIEIIQALNYIGTNFRRLGIIDEASNYHYRALTYSEQFSDDTSYMARKNRVVSLNGIGNIYLTLNNYDAAARIIRMALVGEQQLKSALGQAINYANLGSIYESRGMNDSALVYYQHSMKFNRLAKSDLGISLCYDHFGKLAEKRGDWDSALREYKSAYDIMVKKSDTWHWLESCVSLARVNITKNDMQLANKYLAEAEQSAKKINSLEYLADVYKLKYLFYKKAGDNTKALDCYILSHTYADSISNAEKLNKIQNLRVNYVQNKSHRELSLIQKNYRMEQRTKKIVILLSASILFLFAIALGLTLYALRMKSRSQQMMKKLEQIRNSFLTNVTHEFRTPLTVILGLSRQLKDEQNIDRNTIKHLGEMIERQGDNMLELVNQLLDVSKVKSQIGEPDWRTGNIVAYLRMMMESYQVLARQKKIDLTFAPAEMTIEMDFVPEYLGKIVRNLLSNAMKFTPEYGRIIVTVERKESELNLLVADSGSGIDAIDLPHIFETFYQGSNSEAKMGTGVGLSLVKQMIVCMGGQIEVESSKNSGTIFSISLPIQHQVEQKKTWSPENGTIAVQQYEEQSDEMEDGKIDSILPSILVVEDNADVSYYIGSLLTDNYNVYYAHNGEEGLVKAKEIVPDLIVTDLMMPGMDGYDLCREVRHCELINHIPIIIITAKIEEADRLLGLDVGADAYLNKPFNAEELKMRISKLLEQRCLLREKYSRSFMNGENDQTELPNIEQTYLNRLTDVIYDQMSDYNFNSEALADKMCVSVSQLNRKIKAITGFNSSGYIMQVRMEKARKLLVSTSDPVGEIGVKCGFPDISYFSRMFKMTFKMTTSQCRKSPQ